MKKFLKMPLIVFSVLTVTACGGSEGLDGKTNINGNITVETDAQPQPQPVVNPTNANNQQLILPTLDVPDGTRLLGEGDNVYNSIPLPEPFRYNVSRITDVVGTFAITASGPGYEERSYIVSGEVVFDETVNPRENDTTDLLWCTGDYSTAKLYIDTLGPEMNDNYIAMKCEEGPHNTPQFDYHFVSAGGQFSVHGYLAPNSASALVSVDMHDLSISYGTVCLEVTSVDAHGAFLGLQTHVCLDDLGGADHLRETYPLPLTVFGGESIMVLAYVCYVDMFDHNGKCELSGRADIDQIAQLIELKH